jgi:hypothetical protein
MTQHRTVQGWPYLVVVLDVCSRRVVGWRSPTCASHSSSTPRIWRSRSAGRHSERVHHCDHRAQYTSWAFGQRLREAGLIGLMVPRELDGLRLPHLPRFSGCCRRRCTPLIEEATGKQTSAADSKVAQDLCRIAMVAQPVNDFDGQLLSGGLVKLGSRLLEEVRLSLFSPEIEHDSAALGLDAGQCRLEALATAAEGRAQGVTDDAFSVHVHGDVRAVADCPVDQRQVLTAVEAAAVAHGGEPAGGQRHGGLGNALDELLETHAVRHEIADLD